MREEQHGRAIVCLKCMRGVLFYFFSRYPILCVCEWSHEGIQTQNRFEVSSRIGRPRLKRWGKFLRAL